MPFQNVLASSLLLLSALTSFSNAQGTFAYYTDNSTGIQFWQNTIPSGEDTTGGFQLGIALPPNGTGSDTEYIGRIQGALHNGTLRQGWSGVSHGGEMTDSLLLLAWPDPSGNNSIKTSFRFASDYVAPSLYTGNATLTPIKQSVSDSSFELIYRCQNCFAWTFNGTSASQLPDTHTAVVMGWVQAFAAPSPASSTTGAIKFHDNGYGEFGVVVSNATNANYAQWAALASGSSSASPSSSASSANAIAATSAAASFTVPLPTGTGLAGLTSLLPTGAGGLEPTGFSLAIPSPTSGLSIPGFQPSGFQTVPRPVGTGSPFSGISGHKHRGEEQDGNGKWKIL